MKKYFAILLVAFMALAAFAGCSSSTPSATATASAWAKKEIAVVSREEGSGTRGAFIELFKVQQKDANGKNVDMTTAEAIIGNGQSAVMTTVAGNPDSIGYSSLGSLTSTVKAIKIDGVEPTVANVKNKTYKIARPFNIATKGELKNAVGVDFLAFILSADGQKVVAANKYIPLDNAVAFTTKKPAGKIVVGGSSSVTPLMEKLKEAYLLLNPNATIEVQLSDSTIGMTSTLSGVYEIGMSSRELKESEITAGLKPVLICTDGLAVIVNNANPLTGLTTEQVTSIFTGKTTLWGDLIK